MSLPLVFHDDYSPPLPPGHRFPMEKFRLLRDHLVDSGLTTDAALRRPMLCRHDVLNLAHDADYVARYCSGDMSPAELRRLGLPWSPALAQRTVRAVGGSLLTAELALQHGRERHNAESFTVSVMLNRHSRNNTVAEPHANHTFNRLNAAKLHHRRDR